MSKSAGISLGFLDGIKIYPTPLDGRETSFDASTQEQLEKGLELIPRILKIRRVNQHDIERIGIQNVLAFGILAPRVDQYLIEWDRNFSHAVYGEKQDLISKTLLALRLLKEGVVVLRFLINIAADTTIPNGMSYFPSSQHILSINYILYIDEINHLSKILEKIMVIDFEKKFALKIACDRLNKLYETFRPEDKLIDLCIGFEALFLKGEQFSSKGQTIGLAVSMLLGKNMDHRDEISNAIKLGYIQRNRMVHGRDYDKKLVNNITFDLESLLRKSILKFIL